MSVDAQASRSWRGPQAPWKRSLLQRPAVVAGVFLAPFLLLYGVFRVWPIIQALLLSFQDVQGIGASEWTGLDNYRELATDSSFWQSLRTSALYTLGTIVLLIPIPFALAAVLESRIIRRPSTLRTAYFLPVLTSLVVVGVVFSLLLSDNGLVNRVLSLVGIPAQPWLESKALAIPSLLILAVWRWTGINIIYFTTGLANIPNDIYEAAEVDGASRWQQFWHISVPLCKPIILFVTILTLFGSFQLFVEPYILWNGTAGPGGAAQTIVLYLYRTAFTSFRLGYASAIGVVLAAIIMVLSIAQLRMFGFFKKDEQS